jgi:hypothetical protein
MYERFERLKNWMLLHERALSATGLFAGFLFDTLTANRPDAIYTNLIILSYFVLAASCILLVTLRGAQSTLGPLPLLTLLQFSFGNLSSALLVLYGKSGTFLGSGVFIAVLALFLIGNEFLRSRYTRIHVLVATWFLLFLPYCAMFVPIVWGKIGDGVFLVSTAVALGLVTLYVLVLKTTAPATVVLRVPTIAVSVSTIYAAFVAAYFFNVMPPVPLSISHMGTYHSIERTTEGNYRMTYQPREWYQFWRDTAYEYVHEKGTPAYCFSSVFAPDGLSTRIYHRWEQYDALADAWNTVTYISFPIQGGRSRGYRGYTETYRLTPGLWRCSVETERGARIGVTEFSVVDSYERASDALQALSTIEL